MDCLELWIEFGSHEYEIILIVKIFNEKNIKSNMLNRSIPQNWTIRMARNKKRIFLIGFETD